MTHPFRTVREVGLPSPGYEDWLFVATFTPELPDRLNVWSMLLSVRENFGGGIQLLLNEPEPGVVLEIHAVIVDHPDIIEHTQELLEIIERDGILDDEFFWEKVNPVIQALWDEAAPAARIDLCNEAEIGPEHVLDTEVPKAIHAVIYRQIST